MDTSLIIQGEGYYNVWAASHSECKKLNASYTPPQEVFALGKMVHAIQEGLQVPDATEQAIKMATALAKAVQPLTVGVRAEDDRVEHEVYRFLCFRYGVPVYEKGRIDRWLKGRCVVDYKTTTAKTEQEFIKACHSMGNFEQMARYMTLTKEDTGYIIGVSKHNYKAWVLLLKRHHTLFESAYAAYQASNAAWLEANFGEVNWTDASGTGS